MIGKLLGAATGAAINKEQHGSPVTGAVVGFATMAVARRFLPLRIAGLGATVAAGYLTKKLAERAERRKESAIARETAEDAGVADSFAMIEDANAKPPGAKKPRAKKAAKRNPATALARDATRPASRKTAGKSAAKPRKPAKQSARAIKVPKSS